MEPELLHSRISVAVHIVAAIVISYVSFTLQNTLYAGVLGIVVLIAIGYPLERVAGKKGFKWWFANGIFIYLFIWLVGWTYFLNLAP